jgi:uncharacterized protein (TIGR02266 family)
MTIAKEVVVADDTAFVCDRFKAALETAGHRARTARTGRELLGLLGTAGAHVDLIVLDLRLPQGRGVDLLRRLRGLGAACPPVVVFSGTIASAGEVTELNALGVAGYINEYTAPQHILPSLSPHLFPEHYNRRVSPRVTIGVPVSYRVGNMIASAVTLNVGYRGLAVRTTSPLEVGTSARVRFRVPGGKTEVEGEAHVAWARSGLGMGLRFGTLSADVQATLDAFVRAHFFTNRKA